MRPHSSAIQRGANQCSPASWCAYELGAKLGCPSVDIEPSRTSPKLLLVQPFVLDDLIPSERLRKNLKQGKPESLGVVGIPREQLSEQLVTAVSRLCVLLPSSPNAVGTIRAAYVKVTGFFREDKIDSSDGLQRRPPVPMRVRVPVKFLHLAVR